MVKKNKQKKSTKKQRERSQFLICVMIAFVLWTFTKLSYTYKSSMVFNIEYLLDTGLTFTERPPKQLTVDVNGSGWDIIQYLLLGKKKSINLDLKGKDNLNISSSLLNNKVMKMVPDVSIINIDPSSIEVHIEPMATKNVTIKPQVEYKLARLHHLKNNIKCTPSKVKITGPASLLSNISVCETQLISIEEPLSSTTSYKTKLLNPDPSNLDLSNYSVETSIEVEAMTEKSLDVDIEIIPESLSGKVILIPGKANLNFLIGLSQYDAVGPEDFKIQVDFSEIDLQNGAAVNIVCKQKPDIVKSFKYSPKNTSFILKKTD